MTMERGALGTEAWGEEARFLKWLASYYGSWATAMAYRTIYAFQLKNSPLYQQWLRDGQQDVAKERYKGKTGAEKAEPDEYGVFINTPRQGDVTLPGGQVSTLSWWQGLPDAQKLQYTGIKMGEDIVTTASGQTYSRSVWDTMSPEQQTSLGRQPEPTVEAQPWEKMGISEAEFERAQYGIPQEPEMGMTDWQKAQYGLQLQEQLRGRYPQQQGMTPWQQSEQEYRMAQLQATQGQNQWLQQQGMWQRGLQERQLGLQEAQMRAELAANPASWIEAHIFDWERQYGQGGWQQQQQQDQWQYSTAGQMSQVEGWEKNLTDLRGDVLSKAMADPWNPQVQEQTQQALQNINKQIKTVGQTRSNVQEAMDREQSAISAGTYYGSGTTRPPRLPEAPAWLPQFAPEQVAGQPITQQPARTASGQAWGRTPWAQRQQLGGFVEWAGSTGGAQTLTGYEELVRSQLPRKTEIQPRYRTARQI